MVENIPLEGGNAQTVEVSISPSVPAGTFKDLLNFRLKGAPVPEIQVPVEGVVHDDIQAEPSQIFFGRISIGRAHRKTVIVQSQGTKDFRILAVQSSSPQILAQANSNVLASAHAVEVSVEARDRIGSILQETIRLTLSSGRVLTIPITGMVVAPNADTPMRGFLKPDMPAPDFHVIDANGNPWQLSDFRGKNLVLTFFPKCFTGGCAAQLASLQLVSSQMQVSNVQVVAVSVDPANDQRTFSAKLGLQFPLIPDVDRSLSLLYDAVEAKTDRGRRQSVLIDKNGIVRWIDTHVDVEKHGVDVLAKLSELGMIEAK
jgi:peroxiredoxin Q/BCP